MIAICRNTRTTLFHDDERIARIIRYAAKTVNNETTTIVYSTGADVAKRQSGHTIITPEPIHAAIRTANFPAEKRCFRIEELIFFVILKLFKTTDFAFAKSVVLKF